MAKPLPIPDGDEYVKARRSKLHGRGLFAALDIPKGSYIMEYTGKKVPRKEGDRRAEKQWKKGRIYVFRLNKRFDIDGLQRRNKARLANHSCDPNAESQNERGRRIWVVATRDIQKGEEITYDYHLGLEDEPAVCLCGSPKCIGYMVGPDDHKALYKWLVDNGRPVPPNLAKRVKKRPKAARATGDGAGKAAKKASKGGKSRKATRKNAAKDKARTKATRKNAAKDKRKKATRKNTKKSNARKATRKTTKKGAARKK